MAITRFFSRFQPSEYHIKLDINRQAKTINGHVTVTGTASDATVLLHQKNLVVDAVTLNDQAVEYSVDDATEAIKIFNVTPGTITLGVTYHTQLTDTMMGIYPSYYQLNGKTEQIIGTQFETTFARQAFPCVDEPEAKAVFNLAIKFDEQPGETILANMPEDHQADGYHYFKPTVKMSSYLVAFAFGKLIAKKTKTTSGVEVGVFATPAHKEAELDFALDIAKRSIEFYEDFYDTKYPLPHSWQLALPDFSAGAMENWGLVTYREAYLLVDQQNARLNTKRVVATVIAHELAHQWFGDLVTMKWWDDLWLNESFANMMEYVCVDALEPDWKIWELFQTSEAPAALQRDATFGVQSVHVEVADPAEIDALFDGAIVYAKGARMLVMVRSLIGDDALRKGLKAYFAAHQYGNACGDDLWTALGAAANIDLKRIMEGWLTKPGYPVVTVKLDEAGNLILHQEQFNIGAANPEPQLWQIPLNANFKTPQLLDQADLNLGSYASLRQATGKALRLNCGNNAHYIVHYAPQLLKDILAEFDQLDAIDQRALLQDLNLLAQGQRLNYAEVIAVLPRFADHPAAIVNDELFQTMATIKNLFGQAPENKANLARLYGKLANAAAHRLGFEPQANESNDVQLVRPLVLAASLKADDAQTKQAAHQLFEQHQASLQTLPAATRGLVLQNEVKNYHSDALVTDLLHLYQTATDASFKQDLQAALTSTTDAASQKLLFAQFKDANVIKPQDLRAWYRGLLANLSSQAQAWNWLTSNWNWLEAKIGGDMEFATFLTVTANVFATQANLDDFRAFFLPKVNVPGLTREIKMDIEKITAKVALTASQAEAVTAALADAAK